MRTLDDIDRVFALADEGLTQTEIAAEVGMGQTTVSRCSYAYPRYFFTNRSADIRGLFVEACERLDVEWRQTNRFDISVARRASVERLDAIVGPKS